jgi:hypothetical protein
MAAIAEGVAVRATAAAHQHGGRLLEAQFIGHTAGSQMGAVADPAVAAEAAAAELVHAGRQLMWLRARSGGSGLRHDGLTQSAAAQQQDIAWRRSGRTVLTAWAGQRRTRTR